MEYMSLGHSGLKVSRICLGMMNFGAPKWREWTIPEADARPFVRRALELGINFYDTADMYSDGESEAVTGKLLLEWARRDEVVIATKVYMPVGQGVNQRGLSRVHIMNAIDASLKRLGTDYVDLYQIHRFDPETPVEETMEALHDVVKAGKARYIGASNMPAWRLARYLYTADLHGWTRFTSMQSYYNLIYREDEREVLPLCREEGMGLIPWSPLARGLLAGNRRRDGTGKTVRAKSDARAQALYGGEADFQVLEQVERLAGQRGVAPAQIALAWLLHQPGLVAPIVGVTKMEHLEQAAAAVDIALTGEECALLEAPYKPRSADVFDRR